MFKHITSTSNKSVIQDVPFPIDKWTQPNAADLYLDRVWTLSRDRMILSEEVKSAPNKTEVNRNDDDWFLLPAGFYELQFYGSVQISSNEVGWVIPRSTLIRNGMIMQSGLFDSGYEGPIGCGMLVSTSSFKVKRGTRLAQFVLAQAEAIHLYDGQYSAGKQAAQQYL